MRFGSIPMAVLRTGYRAARVPLQLLEEVGISHLNPGGRVRLAYERLLVECDSAAGHLLHDGTSAARANALRTRINDRHTATLLEARAIQLNRHLAAAAADARWAETARHRDLMAQANVVHLDDRKHPR